MSNLNKIKHYHELSYHEFITDNYEMIELIDIWL